MAGGSLLSQSALPLWKPELTSWQGSPSAPRRPCAVGIATTPWEGRIEVTVLSSSFRRRPHAFDENCTVMLDDSPLKRFAGSGLMVLRVSSSGDAIELLAAPRQTQ